MADRHFPSVDGMGKHMQSQVLRHSPKAQQHNAYLMAASVCTGRRARRSRGMERTYHTLATCFDGFDVVCDGWTGGKGKGV